MISPRTAFLVALRPFSLIVAIATCSLGIVLAAGDGVFDPLLAALVVCGGVLLQGGVNLINDHADLHRPGWDAKARERVLRNARLGATAMLAACAIGLHLIALRGWPMALIGGVGVLGGWGYTAGPLRMKSRGLGLVAVFFLTGVLMVAGAYFAMAGRLSLQILWIALPFSLYASLLLLANELRDYEADVRDGHGTFTARFGYRQGSRLFLAGTVALALITLTLFAHYRRPLLLLALLALVLLSVPLRLLRADADQRVALGRYTGRCYAAYALPFVLAFWEP